MESHKPEYSDFSAEVARILPLIMREFARSQHAGIFSKIPLTVPQMLILEILAERESCKMSELARALNFTMSAITAIVDKMINLKLVRRERSRTDRRVVNVIMLNKGRHMVEEIKQARCDCIDEMFSMLTRKDREEYIRILKKVYNNLRHKQ